MAIARHTFELPTSTGDIIRGDLFIDDAADRAPLIFTIHGYTGYKDWGPMPAMCTWFAERGMACVAFNYSYNGIGDDPMRITETELFSRNTVSRELEELELIVESGANGELPCATQCDLNAIVLLGHSRGGAEAIIAGKELPAVRAVATWGTVGYFDRWTERQKSLWRKEGKRVLQFTRLDTHLEISVGYLDDLERNAARFNIGWNVATLNKPLLLVHGAQDVTVSPEESRQLYDVADKTRTTLEIIPAAGHTFGATHPFTVMPPALERALQSTLDFVHGIATRPQ